MQARAEQASQARRAFDRRFGAVDFGALEPRPRRGWVRAIREAIGMRQTTLAQRLGVTRDAVWKLERAEADGRITLAKLEQIAEAMECRLVYAIVPRTTLRELVLKRARSAAQERLGYALHTMELEAQGVEPQSQAESLDRLAEELVDSGRLWS